MKKMLALAIVFALCLSLCSFAAAEGIVGVSAITKNFEVYHRIAALIIEYDASVVAPGMDAYEIIDKATASYKAAEEVRESDTAVITAVYTNSEPVIREDKTSVEGNYVVIEIEGNFPVVKDEELGYYVVENTACLATWRRNGESCQNRRRDFSEMTVTQLVDVKAADGTVVAAAGVVPELQYENLTNLILDDFQQLTLESPRGYDIHYNLYLPEGYEQGKMYPLVISIGGGDSKVDYRQQTENGELACLGGNISADQVATRFADCGEDVIILSHQLWGGTPEEWGVDNVEDGIYLFDYIIANYKVDKNRVYAIGSSAGTVQLSSILVKRPDILTGYLQCNGGFTGGINENFVMNRDARGARSGYTVEKMWTEINEKRMDSSLYIDEAIAIYKPVIMNGPEIYMIADTGDETGACLNTMCAYIAMNEAALALGYTQEQFDEKVTLDIRTEQEMLDTGICKFHSTSKYAVLLDDVVNWLLTR